MAENEKWLWTDTGFFFFGGVCDDYILKLNGDGCKILWINLVHEHTHTQHQ